MGKVAFVVNVLHVHEWSCASAECVWPKCRMCLGGGNCHARESSGSRVGFLVCCLRLILHQLTKSSVVNCCMVSGTGVRELCGLRFAGNLNSVVAFVV